MIKKTSPEARPVSVKLSSSNLLGPKSIASPLSEDNFELQVLALQKENETLRFEIAQLRAASKKNGPVALQAAKLEAKELRENNAELIKSNKSLCAKVDEITKDVSLIVEIHPHNANFDVMSMFSVFIYLNEKLNEVKFPNYRKSI